MALAMRGGISDMYIPDVARSLGALTVIFFFGAAFGVCAIIVYSDPATMRNMYREQMWQEAVDAGVAEKLETSQGPGYRWKER